jgi:hypothetical protein
MRTGKTFALPDSGVNPLFLHGFLTPDTVVIFLWRTPPLRAMIPPLRQPCIEESFGLFSCLISDKIRHPHRGYCGSSHPGSRRRPPGLRPGARYDASALLMEISPRLRTGNTVQLQSGENPVATCWWTREDAGASSLCHSDGARP